MEFMPLNQGHFRGGAEKQDDGGLSQDNWNVGWLTCKRKYIDGSNAGKTLLAYE